MIIIISKKTNKEQIIVKKIILKFKLIFLLKQSNEINVRRN